MKDYQQKYPDERNLPGTNHEKLQRILLRQLKIFDDVCREHNLTYWLESGTLLGAVRHKGFIPWDDDIDIAMLREDYERFKEIADDILPKELYLQTIDRDTSFRYFWLKIRDRNSIAMEQWEQKNEGKYHMGIMMDIFPFDFIEKPKSYFFFKTWFVCQFENKVFNFFMCILRELFVFIVRKPRVIRWANAYFKRHKNTKYLGKGCDCPFLAVYETKDVLPVKRIEFEGRYFCVPNNPEKYLEIHYGDYMKLPSEESRKAETHFVRLDVNTPCAFEQNLRKEGR
ncbi:MAG: LicD family protein [Cytophagales bacterium]|nr:LicD family protein [Cytophagales bacterium]